MYLGKAGRRLLTNCCSIVGGNSVAGLFGLGLTSRKSTREGNAARYNSAFGQHTTTGVNIQAGFPLGYRHPSCWVWPIKSGALSNVNQMAGAGNASATGTLGKNAEALLTGSGNVTSVAQLIVSLLAGLTGSGEISQADVEAFLQLAAALTGSGDLTSAIRAIGNTQAALTGLSSTDTSTIRANGTLASSITVTGEVLTTGNIADAVWTALAEGNFSYGQCLQIIASACGGKTTGSTFRDLSDTTNRIVGTVTGVDRTAVTYNLD